MSFEGCVCTSSCQAGDVPFEACMGGRYEGNGNPRISVRVWGRQQQPLLLQVTP